MTNNKFADQNAQKINYC